MAIPDGSDATAGYEPYDNGPEAIAALLALSGTPFTFG